MVKGISLHKSAPEFPFLLLDIMQKPTGIIETSLTSFSGKLGGRIEMSIEEKLHGRNSRAMRE